MSDKKVEEIKKEAAAQEHVLSTTECALINQFDVAIADLAKRREGALLMAIASRDLKGNWGYADGKLIQAPTPKAPEPQK